jgi:threonine dehydratase
MTGNTVVDRKAIAAMAQHIAPYVRTTPLLEVDPADFGLPPIRLTLKLELLQHTGSFKARGAFANLLGSGVPAAGVAAASGGNHGAAVAFAARRLDLKARIFVPSIASPAKISRIRSYGADLVVAGERYVDALAESERFIAASGAQSVHAYDAVKTLLGQGTLGLELERQLGAFDSLLVAVGGGGLIGGIAAWFRGGRRIVGVEPETSKALASALDAGRPVDVEVSGVAADSLGARRVGSLVYPLAKQFVERVALVSDEAISEAQRALWDVTRIVAEPGGAAAFAALLSGVYRPKVGEHVCVLVCGANTTAVDFGR